MLNKASFPLYFIKELCNNETLFLLKEAIGETQSAVIPKTLQYLNSRRKTVFGEFKFHLMNRDT